MSSRSHAIARAKERHNLDLTEQDIENMIELIQNGQSYHISKSSRRRAVHILNYNGIYLPVVYRKKRLSKDIETTIITILSWDDALLEQLENIKNEIHDLPS